MYTLMANFILYGLRSIGTFYYIKKTWAEEINTHAVLALLRHRLRGEKLL
jgi:hypothetical protein